VSINVVEIKISKCYLEQPVFKSILAHAQVEVEVLTSTNSLSLFDLEKLFISF
jgi:hypothetical protein